MGKVADAIRLVGLFLIGLLAKLRVGEAFFNARAAFNSNLFFIDWRSRNFGTKPSRQNEITLDFSTLSVPRVERSLETPLFLGALKLKTLLRFRSEDARRGASSSKQSTIGMLGSIALMRHGAHRSHGLAPILQMEVFGEVCRMIRLNCFIFQALGIAPILGRLRSLKCWDMVSFCGKSGGILFDL